MHKKIRKAQTHHFPCRPTTALIYNGEVYACVASMQISLLLTSLSRWQFARKMSKYLLCPHTGTRCKDSKSFLCNNNSAVFFSTLWKIGEAIEIGVVGVIGIIGRTHPLGTMCHSPQLRGRIKGPSLGGDYNTKNHASKHIDGSTPPSHVADMKGIVQAIMHKGMTH